MKLSLQLKLGQQLTMTPQLQQAIRLLQLSTLDLQQEIHEALESNPMLELIENNEEELQGNKTANDLNTVEDPIQKNAEINADAKVSTEQDTAEDSWQDQIPNDLSVDTNWDDIYPETYTSSGSFDGNSADFESRDTADDSLQDHLHWQLNLTPMSDQDNSIALAIIDAIDINGMLTVDVPSLIEGFDPELEIEEDEVLAVLHRIQQFDPVGVAYRDLSECLTIQLGQYEVPGQEKLVENAKLIIRDYIDLLGHRDYAQLMRRTKLKEAELSETISIIESLNPRPGSDIAPPATSYIVPDVIVSKTQSGKWKVELNPETAPKIRINDSYASLVKRADSSEENSYLRDNLQEAKWFIKSLQSRNETLMKVSTRIVEHQKGFLEYGEEAMKPLVLHDIAEAVSMHESTISRVTTQKYMHTPRGIFELKYFFSSHVSTSGGGECSSTAIRAIIKKLVAAENSRKPLSDSKITNLLEEKGINVARRTIAKYRESLSIPPSNERKRLAG
ncbi:MAG: RNA polymerase factor sigma-54 [Gammaproteobacteria bacterium]|jgi:RNA polymerase sigma-54 factor|nr:RNA polymerase factor sigma-54 [Gammaproteobacteria bacterium]MBT3859915.1 RNA polymerase factor sigma-54 [Gammaproteobacteria bacterium]MBT3986377.1 RNA polymerase factor sigma-54 [Gammaproteobacteria bacterium]MBT4255030.1 RNA polymerase factor sigma-54 [Gammaproteobacteria bacterium]MBT4582937.1 RNA polymerase factor sigma-54 [Gammaproteobacteria bacterium]